MKVHAVILLLITLAATALAQSVYNETGAKVAAAVKFSSLGAGVEVATPVTHRSNIRFGFNAFSYSRGFDKDNIHYSGDIGFRSIEAHYDFFPFGGGFHVSPGVLIYLRSPVEATAGVPGGQTFTLGNASFLSDPASPVTGSAKMDFNQAGPTFTVGWGNILARSSKRFTVPFEVGFVYQGSPKSRLNLAGSACDPLGVNCRNAVNDPIVQSQVLTEQNKINSDTNFLQVYPIISIGFGFKF